MLEGFGATTFSSPKSGGRPALPTSTLLRNLAWLRFLLNALNDVEAWSLGSAGRSRRRRRHTSGAPEVVAAKPFPAAWMEEGHADASTLRMLFADKPPKISEDACRTPSLLDDVFGGLFSGRDGANAHYFADPIARGLFRPEKSKIDRLDALVPGSHRAFFFEPELVDPWFYDALDFSNPWFAKLYLWRACDPHLQDPHWSQLVEESQNPNEGMPRLLDRTRSEASIGFTISEGDAVLLGEMIPSALALAAEPGLVDAPAGEVKYVASKMLAAAAASDVSGEHPIAKSVASMSRVDRWAALSNAVAGCRLAAMVKRNRHVAAWWLRGVRQALQTEIDAVQREHYCRVPAKPKTLPALDTVLDEVGLTSPKAVGEG